MVPNRPSSKIFKIKGGKFEEYGAKIASGFDLTVTHVLVDPDWDGKRTLNYIHYTPERIKREVDKGIIKIVRDEWPSACIEHKKLIPESPDYIVPLVSSPEHSPAPSPEIPSVSSPEGDYTPLKKKNYTSTSSDSSSPTDISRIHGERTNQPASSSHSNTDELDSMIKQAELEKHAANFLSDDEIESALSSYNSKYSRPRGPRPRAPKTSDGRVLKGKWDAFLCMKEGEYKDSSSSNSDSEGPNDMTIKILSLMLDHYEAEGDQWRTQAYRKAIKTLKNQKVPIRTAAQAVKLPGVGSRLADKIEEINKTGDLKRLKFTQKEGKDGVYELLKGIYGVGPKIAKKWYSEGIRTLDDVRKRTDLTNNQKISLEHYEDFSERIPRDQVTKHFNMVADTVHKIDPKVEVTAMGSYRRLQPDCGDIDIILTKPNASKRDLCVILAKLLDRLFDIGFAKYTFGGIEADSMRWLGATAHPEDGYKWRRMDILLVPWEERGAAFIYYTGNDILNRSMRLLAGRKGYHLNEKGLFLAAVEKGGSAGALVCGDDEEKIFEILGVPYRPPHKRIIG